MNSRNVVLIAFAVVLLSVAAVYVTDAPDSSDAATANSVRVFVEADGEYKETQSAGSSVKQIIENACDNLGLSITYTKLGAIDSVGGTKASSDETWNIHQWMPLGVHDWSSVGFDMKSDSQIIDGTSYCLHMSSQALVNQSLVYETPDFEPESDGYVFIRFGILADDSSEEVQNAFTTEDRINGFWIKGHGSNMGEVVESAMKENGFECSFTSSKDGNGNDLQYWITSFFGISGSTNMGSSMSWAYWSQYMYIDDKWTYNNWTLGYYDPGVYKYIACVYIVSIDYTEDSGEDNEVTSTLPKITDSSSIASQCKRSLLNVTFKLDGETFYKTTARNGKTLSDTIPSVSEQEGKYFSGWGDITKVITEDTVFEGYMCDLDETKCQVVYKNESGRTINVETGDVGFKATYALKPTKASDSEYNYYFKCWSSDGTNAADLDSVTENLTVKPLFEAKKRPYKVTFYDYDGNVLAVKGAEYGTNLTSDLPATPTRADTVDKVFTFAGWYITTYTNTIEDKALQADLTNITSTKVVYAAYTYVAHPYTLTVNISDGETVIKEIAYGGFLKESFMIDSVPGFALKFYRDSEMTQTVGTSYIFTGDTTLYAEKLPGTYSYTDADGKCVTVAMDSTSAALLKAVSGAYTICDISQFSEGKSVQLGSELLSVLKNTLGQDAYIRIILSRGEYILGLYTLLGLIDPSGTDGFVFSVDKGPTTSVRINTSLKNVNYDNTYTMTVKHNGKTLSAEGLGITASVSYEEDSAVSPRVWSANPNTGLLTTLDCSYSDGKLSFSLTDMVYYVAGTSGARTDGGSGKGYTCPYGEVEYTCRGESESTYNSTLDRMTIDNGGDVLYIPSALEGYPLKHIGAQAFSGVTNTSILVIPATVETFDWASLYGSSVREVYFLGDKPEFTGDAPASITAYHSDKASGWTDDTSSVLTLMTYSKGSFSFRYYLIGDQITVAQWVKGTSVDIPSYISVSGTEYPVTVIGCNAFAESSLEYIRIPDTVVQIQTRAFYKCQALEQLAWGSSPSVGILADECFRGCINLRSTTATIPDGVGFIGFEAFRDCQMFRTIVVPNTVTDIRGGAFYNCVLLAEVTLSNSITLIPERCFGYCNSLDGVILPDSVTEIADNAFYSCDMLTSINLNKTQTVGIYAFYDCGTLSSVTLGAELNILGRDSFQSCAMLSYAYAYCEQPEGLDGSGLTENTSIYVNYDVESQWTADHLVIEKEDDLKQSFEAATMPYVIAGLIILFIVLAIYSWRYRTKNLM